MTSALPVQSDRAAFLYPAIAACISEERPPPARKSAGSPRGWGARGFDGGSARDRHRPPSLRVGYSFAPPEPLSAASGQAIVEGEVLSFVGTHSCRPLRRYLVARAQNKLAASGTWHGTADQAIHDRGTVAEGPSTC